jgi:hypothetical protein
MSAATTAASYRAACTSVSGYSPVSPSALGPTQRW